MTQQHILGQGNFVVPTEDHIPAQSIPTQPILYKSSQILTNHIQILTNPLQIRTNPDKPSTNLHKSQILYKCSHILTNHIQIVLSWHEAAPTKWNSIHDSTTYLRSGQLLLSRRKSPSSPIYSSPAQSILYKSSEILTNHIQNLTNPNKSWQTLYKPSQSIPKPIQVIRYPYKSYTNVKTKLVFLVQGKNQVGFF